MSPALDLVIKALALLWVCAVVGALLAILTGKIDDWLD